MLDESDQTESDSLDSWDYTVMLELNINDNVNTICQGRGGETAAIVPSAEQLRRWWRGLEEVDLVSWLDGQIMNGCWVLKQRVLRDAQRTSSMMARCPPSQKWGTKQTSMQQISGRSWTLLKKRQICMQKIM
eukprot:scaffold31962_cov99-Cyclotella_meneghiniana.AAC.1